MTNISISINGKKFTGFDGIQLNSRIDSITSALSFNSFERFGTLNYQDVKVYRNDVLIFTGQITDYDIVYENNNNLGVGITPPRPNGYTAYSLPYVLEDCSIPLDLYPLQTENTTLKDLVLKICDYYDITLVIDRSAISEVNTIVKAVDSNPATKCSDFVNALCTQQGLILSHNEKGDLVITKEIRGRKRSYPTPIKSNYKVSGRGLYRTHIGMGQQGILNTTPIQAENVTSSIKANRNITKIQSKGDNDTISSFVFGVKADTFKNITIPETYNDFFPNLGDIKSINSVDYLVNNFVYSFNSKDETCTLTRYRGIVYER